MKASKKLFSVLLAVVMLLSLGVTALAANDPTVISKHDLTVNDVRENRTYVAYQILKGSYAMVNGQPTLGDVEWGSDVDSEYASKDVVEFLDEHFGGDKNTAESARKLAEELYPAHVNTETGGTTLSRKADGSGYEALQVDSGYYLIVDETEGGVHTSYIVEVVQDVNVTPKVSDTPEFEKKVDDVNDSTSAGATGDSADYDVGDHVPFTLTATMPQDYTEYRHYKMVFHDTMSAGLTFDEGSVHVFVDGTEITTGFVVAGSGQSLTVTIDDAKLIDEIGNGSKVVVKYTAELNEHAVLRNTNTANLEYTNDPNWDGDGTPTTDHTPDDTVVVFTFDVLVNKTDEDKEPLEGAEFQLQKYDAASGTWVDKKVVKLDSGTSFSIDGLDDGYYRLIETKTPAGYNTVDDIYFAIVAEHSEGDDPQLTSLKVMDLTYDEGTNTFTLGAENTGSYAIDMTANDDNIKTDVVNQRGLQLPETGGIGTTIFYVAGGILVVVALVLLVTKRRVKAEQ